MGGLFVSGAGVHLGWIMAERMRSQIQATKMGFVRSVAGLSLTAWGVLSCWVGGIRVEPLLLCIDRSQLRWFSKDASCKPPFRGFLFMSHWMEAPGKTQKSPGNTSGFPEWAGKCRWEEEHLGFSLGPVAFATGLQISDRRWMAWCRDKSVSNIIIKVHNYICMHTTTYTNAYKDFQRLCHNPKMCTTWFTWRIHQQFMLCSISSFIHLPDYRPTFNWQQSLNLFVDIKPHR